LTKGEDYQVGDTLQHGCFDDTVQAVWSASEDSPLMYLVTGPDCVRLTIYAVERKTRTGPRLARYIPLQLFLDLNEEMLEKASKKPKKKPGKKRKVQPDQTPKILDTAKEARPGDSVCNAAPVKRTQKPPAEPPKEAETADPPLRRRRQKRKNT